MHFDWRFLSLSGYFEGLEAHNLAHDPAGAGSPSIDSETADRLSRFNKAHGVG